MNRYIVYFLAGPKATGRVELMDTQPTNICSVEGQQNEYEKVFYAEEQKLGFVQLLASFNEMHLAEDLAREHNKHLKTIGRFWAK